MELDYFIEYLMKPELKLTINVPVMEKAEN